MNRQTLSDMAILSFASVWVAYTARREYFRLFLFQLPYLAFPIRVAVPRLANEKYLWRKMFDHNPLFITASDKIAAKEWVETLGLDIKMPKTLWVGTDAGEIPAHVWKEKMYLKGAHGFRMNIPVLDAPDDVAEITERANAFLTVEHGKRRREWAYKGVPRRLIAERAIQGHSGLIEIKCFTYGPVVEQFLVLRRGPPETGARWERMEDGGFELSKRATTTSSEIDTSPLPDVTAEAIETASQIGAHFDHVRVDFLTDGKILYLGEITVYHDAGRAYRQGHYESAPANRSWDLRRSWFLTHPQAGWKQRYAEALNRALDKRAARQR